MLMVRYVQCNVVQCPRAALKGTFTKLRSTCLLTQKLFQSPDDARMHVRQGILCYVMPWLGGTTAVFQLT